MAVNPLKTLLVHGTGISRDLLAAYLRASHAIESLQTADDGIQFLQILEPECPELLIIKTGLAGLDGISALKEARRRGCRARAIMLASGADARGYELIAALQAGISAYLVAGDGIAEFRKAVDAVRGGSLYVSPQALDGRDLSELIQHAHHHRLPFDTLTAREKEILSLIASGLTSAAIACKLSISRNTVDGHRARLMTKTRSHSVVDLVHWAQTVRSAPSPG